MEVKNSISRAYCCLQKRHRNFEKRKKVSVKVLPKGIHLNSVFSEPVYISILFSNSNASDRDFLIAKTPTSASQEHHSVSTHPLMSFLIPVFVGCLAVYLAWRLIPRSNVEIKDKYVLITGCDSGFGRKTAIRLDEMGVRVIATCLTKEGEQNLKSVTSDRLKTFQMDVTNSQNIRDVFDEVERRIPDETGLWGLVNNAGIHIQSPIDWQPLDNFKRIADVNLWGMIDVTKTFLPLVKKARGRVVTFSSTAGRIAFSCIAPYAVTKYGVEAFSDALRREMYSWGIKVSIMEPGCFQTGMTQPAAIERQLRQCWDNLSDELKKEYGEEYLEKSIALSTLVSPSGRTGDVVDAVVDALTSQTPRDRYLIGFDAKFIFAWLALFPTSMADFILKRLVPQDLVPLGSK